MESRNSITKPSLTPREGGLTPRSKRKRARALLLVRSRSQHDVRERSNPSSPRGKKGEEEWEEEKEEKEREDGAELSIDPRAPGLLKIFGESVVTGAQYKTVLASMRSTAQELIKQALERYGLPTRLHREFVLCEVAGRVGEGSGHCQSDNPRRADRRIRRRGERSGLNHLFRSRSKSPGRDKRRRPPNSARLDDSDKTKQRSEVLLERARSSSPPLPCNSPPSSAPSRTKPKQPRSSRGLQLVPCMPSRSTLALSHGHFDSPRTPLGSPRTPCGSPSTSRGSPRTSVCNVTDDADPRPEHNQVSASYSPRHLANFERTGEGTHSLSPRRSSPGTAQRIFRNENKPRSRFDVDSARELLANSLDKNRYEEIQEVEECREENLESQDSEWTEISFRVLSNKDRPLLLQGFWKPPEGLFRRFELRRRRDVAMSLDGNDSNDDTFGLNDNARKIMMSKVSPGVIPIGSSKMASTEDEDGAYMIPNRRATLKEEWDKASMMTNATLTYGSPRSPSVINAVEGDTRQAYVCPSIYPYLLTLRGCSIQKDLVLYPLKSRSLSIGSSEKKHNSDDICLCAEDILPVHCRVSLKRLPQGEREDGAAAPEDQRLYWYCLDLDIYESAYLTVNGVQAKHRATIYPGDLLGIGRQYLFLYKDPTGGHDIPSAVPWLPADQDPIDPLYARVCRDFKDNQQPKHPNGDRARIIPPSQDYSDMDELNDSALRDAAIFLAYHKDKEVDVLEAIAEVNCSGRDEFSSSLAVLYLAAHHYCVRKFSGDHQTTFFKRLVRVIRARVGFVSKSLSQQRYPSHVFGITDKNQDKSEPDYFPSLIAWLSNIMTLLGHFRSPEFQAQVNSLAKRANVTSALQECINCLEETVNFLFQQSVYTVTKALYNPINSLVQQGSDSTSEGKMDIILDILNATQNLADGLLLHKEVSKQLMAYLLFFLSTSLFNRVITKGAQLYNRDFGTALQADMTKLENWASKMGLASELTSFSEHLMSLTDLLASSKRSLMRLDWEGFQRQFSPLTDPQLCKILSEYNLGEGTPTPPAWYPHYAVDGKQDLTLSLSSHPQFNIPQNEVMISLSETFPPAFFRRLEQVQHKFSLVGEDAYYSGLSSAGNTPRLSESMTKNEKASASPFFLQESTASSNHLRSLLADVSHQVRSGTNPGGRENAVRSTTKPAASPIAAPEPNRVPEGDTELNMKGNELHHRLNPQQQFRHRPHQELQSQHSQNKYFQKGQIQKEQQADNRENQPPTAAPTAPATAPPPYSLVMESRRRPAEGAPSLSHTQPQLKPQPQSQSQPPSQLQSQPQLQPSMFGNHQHQPTKPLAHAAILKHGTENGPRNVHAKAPAVHSMYNIQALPNFHDKNSWKQLSSHQQPGPGRAQRQVKPVLKSQRSWANSQKFEAEVPQDNLASSYPLMQPRPSSATEIEHSICKSQREDVLRLRSNSALGNKSKYGHPPCGHPVMARRNFVHQQSNRQQGQNYEHVKDSTNMRPAIPSSNNINAGSRENENFTINNVSHKHSNLKRSPRREDLSTGCYLDTPSRQDSATLESRQRNASGSRLLRSSKVDLSDPQSTTADVPPPLPPKGEFLLRRASMGSQNSLESSGHSRPRQDSDPCTTSGSSSLSARGGSRGPGSGSRASVEIQDAADHQYLVYNPNLPVQDMLDHNQNFYKRENKNTPTDPFDKLSDFGLPLQNSADNLMEFPRSVPHIPPLELPDDLIAASDLDSPDDTFRKSSNRIPSDSTTSSFQSDKKLKSSLIIRHGSQAINSNGVGESTIQGTTNAIPTFGSFDVSRSSNSSDKYPDDIYIDVPDCDVDSSGSATSSLKVLPLEDKSKGYESDPGVVAVRYRHAMPEPRDIVTNGEVTGEVFSVSLNKAGSKLGMGLIDGLHTSLKQAGIYVRNVLPDTPAALCGAIRVGDRILAVNGKSIVGADYQSAMLLIRSTGPRLELLVAKCDRSVASKISASAT